MSIIRIRDPYLNQKIKNCFPTIFEEKNPLQKYLTNQKSFISDVGNIDLDER